MNPILSEQAAQAAGRKQSRDASPRPSLAVCAQPRGALSSRRSGTTSDPHPYLGQRTLAAEISPRFPRSGAFCLAICLLAACRLSAAEFYVAPDGSDGNPGTKTRPFATLEQARAAASQNRTAGPATVWLAGGRYITRAGNVFTARDSGTAAAPVTYQAAPGAEVILSAGMMVPPTALKALDDPAWQARLHPAARGKVVEINLAALGVEVAPLNDDFRKMGLPEIFYRGKTLPLSRWPNGEVFTTMEKVTDNGMAPPHGGTFVYRGDEPARWVQALQDEGVWLRGFWRVPWTIEGIKVKSIDPTARTITFDAAVPGGIGSKYERDKNGLGPGDGKEPWQALNLLEEIDQPGEWSIDFRTGTLYLWPPGEIAADTLFIADRKEPVVSFKEASNITLKGIIIDGGMGPGIGIVGGENVLVAGCTVRNVGDAGILIRGGHRHRVVSCDIHDTGQEGISFTGGERRTLTPGGHQIVNNHVYRIGQHYPTGAVVAGEGVGSETVGNLVAHNRIHDVPNGGVVFAGNDNMFEYNEIYRVGLGSSDLGCFYSGGGWTARGNVVRYNFVHHSMNANAFYMDDGDSGNSIYGNVDYKTASDGFVGGGHDQRFHQQRLRRMHARHARRRTGGSPATTTRGTSGCRKTSVPCPTARRRGANATRRWSTSWTTAGHAERDCHPGQLIIGCETDIRKSGNAADFAGVTCRDNIVNNDQSVFVDPENFNFALKPGVAASLGLKDFKPIPFNRIGLYTDEYRATPAPRDDALLRNGTPRRHFDSQTDVDASNR